METRFREVLVKNGFSEQKARVIAGIFTDNSIDGVYSHGFNRFAKFISQAHDGFMDINAEPVRISENGSVERWDGRSGPGPLNAIACTDRAIELAKTNGIGCVAIAHTNHWMRGGTYGWRAAREGFIFIGWSNTIANMPAWGATDARLGNNPFVMAVPHKGEAIVLDMAMSQYSYGAMEIYQSKNEQLPLPGGYATNGELSRDPQEIKKSQRALPMGYWKGAGLSFLLDVVVTSLAGGLAVHSITAQDKEKNLSQIFIAIDPSHSGQHRMEGLITNIINDIHASTPEKAGQKVRYPGERVLTTRKENTTNGVPVLEQVWKEILAL
jgi:3-dehydro-L-gulonate 2-dehydrogenase